MEFPDELLEYAEQSHATTTVWTATHKRINPRTGQPHRWYWRLHPHRAFGSQTFINWAKDCIEVGGFPVRFQWCEEGRNGVCLYDETLWSEEYGEEDEAYGRSCFGGDGYASSFAEAFQDVGSNDYDREPLEPETGFQRLCSMAAANPAYMIEALKTVVDGFKPLLANPNRGLDAEQLDYTVRRAVETQLHETLRRAGIFDDDDDDDIFDDLEAEAEPEVIDAEIVVDDDEEFDDEDDEFGELFDVDAYAELEEDDELEQSSQVFVIVGDDQDEEGADERARVGT